MTIGIGIGNRRYAAFPGFEEILVPLVLRKSEKMKCLLLNCIARFQGTRHVDPVVISPSPHLLSSLRLMIRARSVQLVGGSGETSLTALG